MLLRRLRLPALACAFSLLLCLCIAKPWVGMGTNDDPSYARSAELLAQTGHVVYNGWSAPILGWQLFLGALFIKLFGFSFDVLRLSTVLVAMVMAFVAQRAMVRFGLTEWNATLATLTLILSPIFLPLSFSYMTDIGGLAVLVLCWYGCLRAVQSRDDTRGALWILCAVLVGAVGGTSRQTGWLGVFIIVPCTLWIVRKRRKVVLAGLVAIVLSSVGILEVMRWFARQPHVVGTGGAAGIYNHGLLILVRSLGVNMFELPLLVLPVLLPFIPLIHLRNRRARVTFVVCVVMSAVIVAWILTRQDPGFWLLPSGISYFTAHGIMDSTIIHGHRPVIFPFAVRVVLTLLALAGTVGLLTYLAEQYRPVRWGQIGRSSKETWVLLVPLAAVYLCLLLPRAYMAMMFDRYLLPLLFVVLIVVVRAFQGPTRRRLPVYSFALVLVIGGLTVALTHDAFSMMRARLQAVRNVMTAGVPDSRIDGGWEYNLWTQLVQVGYVPPDLGGRSNQAVCRPQMYRYTPAVKPEYALSFDPTDCNGPSEFPAVTYREWVGPRNVTIYVVKSGPATNNMARSR